MIRRILVSAIVCQAALAGAAAAQTARVRGRVTDYVGHQLLANATVQLAQRGGDRVYTATTDSLGEFRIDSVVPGTYVAGFFHPALEDLGVQAPLVPVDVRTGENIVGLATPTAANVLAATCPPNLLPDSTGLLVGHVVDAESDAPIAGATVRLSWLDVVVDKNGLHQERRVATTKANAQGLFGICGVPGEGGISLVATVDSFSTGSVDVEVPRERVVRQRLAISRANSRVANADTSIAAAVRGTAKLRGTVIGAEGKRLAGAAVMLRGSGRSATTDPQGAYVLDELPGGTQAIDVRAIGYTPRTMPVTLRNGEEARADVQMDTRVQMLDAVKVFGKAPDMSAFIQRRQRGMGRFMTQADIARRQPFDFTSLFYTMPGMRVVTTPNGHVLKYISGISLTGGIGCTPTVFLNNMRIMADEDLDLLVDPRSVTGVEVYGPHEAPAQFMNLSNCASIVVWVGMVPK